MSEVTLWRTDDWTIVPAGHPDAMYRVELKEDQVKDGLPIAEDAEIPEGVPVPVEESEPVEETDETPQGKKAPKPADKQAKTPQNKKG
jgi:hypothetical protein